MPAMTEHVQPADLRDYLHRRLPAGRHTQVRAHLDDCEHCWTAWNQFRWDQARPTRLYRDLAEFLGQGFQPYFDSSRALAREWDIVNPHTNSDIRDFFRTSVSYLYNLVIWEASGHRPDYLTAALPVLRRVAPVSILDYGAGTGSDTLALRDHGFTVIPCDYHSPSTAFLRWRAARAGTVLDVVEPHELTATPDAVRIDAVWVIDTLDHLTDIDQQLGPVLTNARLIICEHLTVNQAHGRQRFHHRRTPEQLTRVFSRYGFAPTAQLHNTSRVPPITTWENQSA